MTNTALIKRQSGLAGGVGGVLPDLDRYKGRAATFALTGYATDPAALWDYYADHQAVIDGYFAHVDTAAALQAGLATETGNLYRTGALSFAAGLVAGAGLVYFFGPRKK